jgi:hypothetical protein
MIWFACPPTDRHASACPNSCSSTMPKIEQYSAMTQPIEE